MKIYKSIFSIVAVVLLMCVIVNAELLDQQQLLEDGGVAFWSDLPQVQTFTPSMSGKLVKLDLGARLERCKEIKDLSLFVR